MTMKAYQIKKYGKHEPLVLSTLPKPVVGNHQLLIRVKAASINPVDYKIRQGTARMILRYKMPLTLGHDFAGVVAEVGGHSKKFKVGDGVFGRIPISGTSQDQPGSFQEFVLVNEEDIALKPTNLSFEQAAAVPLVALTAYQGIHDWLRLHQGQSILITGGAGGVGHVAIQLALLTKAKVFTTVSPEGEAFLEKLGVQNVEYINYRQEKFESHLVNIDAVFDMQGGEDLRHAFDVIRKGGRVASISYLPTASYARATQRGRIATGVLSLLTWGMQRRAKTKQAEFHSFLTVSQAEQLETIAHYIEANQLTVAVQQVYQEHAINEAMEEIMKGKVKGKLVVQFDWA